MTVRDLIDRAYMQVGDTSQVNYTPYQFLEFYNEGNHILHFILMYLSATILPPIVAFDRIRIQNVPISHTIGTQWFLFLVY